VNGFYSLTHGVICKNLVPGCCDDYLVTRFAIAKGANIFNNRRANKFAVCLDILGQSLFKESTRGGAQKPLYWIK
jgi:hypothetical protein